MAVIRDFTVKDLVRSTSHTEVEATVSLIEADGEKFLQIDTYGSKGRAMPGKVSQSLRISQRAFEDLKKLASKHF
jgi:hypothetical protein